MSRAIPEVNYEHEIHRVDGKKTLILYIKEKEIAQFPVGLSVGKAIHEFVIDQFKEEYYGVIYTSTDKDSNRTFKGHYFPPKARKCIRKVPRIYFRNKVSKLRKLVIDGSFKKIEK